LNLVPIVVETRFCEIADLPVTLRLANVRPAVTPPDRAATLRWVLIPVTRRIAPQNARVPLHERERRLAALPDARHHRRHVPRPFCYQRLGRLESAPTSEHTPPQEGTD